MITSEEAQKCIVELTSDKELNEIEIGDLQNKLRVYFTQQEKVNELLELYKRERSMLEKYINGNYQPMGEHTNILKQIDELESELK
jgi:hypothetical protein